MSATTTSERAESPVADRGVFAGKADLVWQILILVGASFYAPMIVWANSAENAGPFGFLLLGLVVLGIAVMIVLVMTRTGLDRRGSVYASAILVFAFTNAGPLLDRGAPRLGLLFGSLLLAAIGYCLRRLKLFEALILWGGLFVFAYPWLVWATTGTSEPSSESGTEPLVADFVGERRDIVILVLDGYANSVLLEEMYGYDLDEFESELAGDGFQVTPDAVANYGQTRLSVAGVLQLDHPVPPGPLTSGDLDALLDVIGGDNVLSDWLVAQGYRHTYVESGWFGTRCSPEVHDCVEGPWPNESLYDVTNRSLLRDLPGFETGRSFSRGALNVMEWLDRDLEGILRDDHADLVHAHLLAPHPPLFLDSDCDFRPQEGVAGFEVGRPDMSAEEIARARSWYVRQLQCVNRTLESLAALADETDAIVIMFGDHGPDSLSQLYTLGSEWNEEQRRERLSAFAAARVPGCDMSEIGSLVNLGRRLVSCVSDTDLPDLPTQTFLRAPTLGGEHMVEVPAPEYRRTR